MRLSITRAVEDVLKPRFIALCAEPELADVGYKREDGCVQYNMIQYSTRWASYCALVTEKMKGLDRLGVFTRKRSAKVLEQIATIASGITAKEVVTTPKRYTTMWD